MPALRDVPVGVSYDVHVTGTDFVNVHPLLRQGESLVGSDLRAPHRRGTWRVRGCGNQVYSRLAQWAGIDSPIEVVSPYYRHLTSLGLEVLAVLCCNVHPLLRQGESLVGSDLRAPHRRGTWRVRGCGNQVYSRLAQWAGIDSPIEVVSPYYRHLTSLGLEVLAVLCCNRASDEVSCILMEFLYLHIHLILIQNLIGLD